MGTFIKVFIIVVLILLFIQRMMPASGVNHISAKDLKKIMAKRPVQLIDVRTPQEFNIDHVKGFKNIPMAELQYRMDELNKNEEVVLLCRSGSRSNRAAKLLKKQGFERLTNVQGGMMLYYRS